MEVSMEMGPMMPTDGSRRLEDMAAELVGVAGRLFGKIPAGTRRAMADLVRSMNCYYSNLIEGEHTYPAQIEQALHKEFSKDPRQRALQQLAMAHIGVQRAIDEGKAPGGAASVEFVLWVHQQVFAGLGLPWWDTLDAGKFRQSNVQVGSHVAPDWKAVPDLMRAFEGVYGDKRLSRIQRTVAVAAAHHRLLWIHPFADGNGRVSRLVSDAMLRDLDLASGLWALSRGLARSQHEYRAYLKEADAPRVGDDGAGSLSLRGLERFCGYFLGQCLDQVRFMGELFEPERLASRIANYARQRELEPRGANKLLNGSGAILVEVDRRGELSRGDAQAATGLGRAWASEVQRRLLREGLLVSESANGPVRLGFPTKVWEHWFPALYLGPAAGLDSSKEP